MSIWTYVVTGDRWLGVFRWAFEYEYLTLFFDINAPGVSEQKMDETLMPLTHVSG